MTSSSSDMVDDYQGKRTQGAPGSILSDSINFWLEYAGVVISEEDARESTEIICDFFELLDEWDRKQTGKQP